MAKKETYRYKHADKIAPTHQPLQQFVNISAEKKNEFEEGKVILTDERGGVATVVATDLAASNGLIHVLDAVVLPK